MVTTESISARHYHIKGTFKENKNYNNYYYYLQSLFLFIYVSYMKTTNAS